MSQKKLILVFVAVAIVLGAFFISPKPATRTDAANEKNSQNVQVAEIRPVAFSPASPYCGFAVGAQRAEVAPEIGGIVQKMFKQEGETVRAGEVIAQIDNSILEAQASSSTQVTADTNKTYTDTKKLYDQKVDEAQAALKKSKASYDSGNATKEDVKLAEESVSSAKRARDLQIAAASVQVSGAQSQSLVAENYAQKQTVRAPFSGTITQRHTTVGSVIAAGMPIYSLSAPGINEIELSVPKQIIEKLSANQAVNLVKENSISTPGFVYAKNPFLNFGSPNGIVRLRQKNPAENSVSAGDYVCAEFPLALAKEVLVVPESSILHEFGDSFVFVVRDKIAHKTNITLGATSAGQTEILTGLQAGDIIVTQGLHEIQDNSPIIY